MSGVSVCVCVHTVHPLLVLDGEVERGGPQLVVRVLGLEHSLQQRELRLVEVQQTLLAVDRLHVESRGIQLVSHSLQYVHIVAHLLRACYLHSTTQPGHPLWANERVNACDFLLCSTVTASCQSFAAAHPRCGASPPCLLSTQHNSAWPSTVGKCNEYTCVTSY